jgi:BirA family biotin operon repressor/biotin-[acetyl-CoA-carboxylase] ligase
MGDELARRIHALLAARGAAWPCSIESFDVIPSTSDRAKELARAGAAEWTVVVATHQTAGRGRQGSAWRSPPGNLALTVLLRPSLSPPQAGLIPLAAGVAVRDALGESGVEAALKWPNDVLVAGRKIAGILAEAAWGSEGMEGVALGIGVNLDLVRDELPLELRESTTSIAAEMGQAPDPARVAAAVLAHVSVWYHALAREGPLPVIEAWRVRSAPWWGRRVEVRLGSRLVRGVAVGIDERGALLLDEQGGGLVALHSGEMRELRLEKK